MKNFGIGVVLGLMLIGMLVSAARVSGAEGGESKTLSPYFFIENENAAADAFPLKHTDVRVRVDGVIADVVVRQTYANEGNIPINARYIFPASTRAAVQGMKMTIGESVIVAKIKEKTTAEKDFDTAKRSGKSASLLRQRRPNVFCMDVANIMPEEPVDIELHYTELLVPTEGVYEFVYPTVVGPRYSNQSADEAPESDQWVANPYLKTGSPAGTMFTITADLSTGMPLHEVACPSHDTVIDFDNASVARVRLKENAGFGGNRDYILRYRLADRQIASGLMLHRGEDENFFLLTVQPPKQVDERIIPPREYIFVVDVSGSMNGFPLDVSKAVLEKLIGGLRPDDIFNVVLFAGASQVMAPSSLPATPENIAAAIRTIDRQEGGGGTELLSALNRAIGIPRDTAFSRSVIVLTDGYIDAEKAVFDTIHRNLSRTNFFAFGIGSSVNRYLIEGIARAGQGEPFVVTRPGEAPAAARNFCNYVKAPLLKDIRLHVEGFDAYDLEPAVIPDMFAERPIVVAGKWKGEAAGRIRVTGNTGEGAYVREFNVAEVRPMPENVALRYMWARTRIAGLSDVASGGEEDLNREEITALGLKYTLLTKYTAFVAVHEEVRNPDRVAENVKQPLPLPEGVSNLAVGGGMTHVPEPEFWLMVAVLVVFLPFAGRRRLPGSGGNGMAR